MLQPRYWIFMWVNTFMQATLLGFTVCLFVDLKRLPSHLLCGRNPGWKCFERCVRSLCVHVLYICIFKKAPTILLCFLSGLHWTHENHFSLCFFFSLLCLGLYRNPKQIGIDRGLLIHDLLRRYPRSVTYTVSLTTSLFLWDLNGTRKTQHHLFRLWYPLPHQWHALYLQLRSPTPSLSPLISWFCGDVCSISYSLSPPLSRIVWRQRLYFPTFMYKRPPVHEPTFTCMQCACKRTCTYTIDGNLAYVITATLSCLGVLSHLALVFAASPLPLSPTPPHINRPFPSSSSWFIPCHPLFPYNGTHKHTQINTHDRGGAKGMIILRNLGLPTIRTLHCFLT